MALRLRQVVLVAPELGPALEEVRDVLGIEPCYHDPGVAEFGLENVLFPIGHQFLEIVAPVQEGTTAGRLLERRPKFRSDQDHLPQPQCHDRRLGHPLDVHGGESGDSHQERRHEQFRGRATGSGHGPASKS